MKSALAATALGITAVACRAPSETPSAAAPSVAPAEASSPSVSTAAALPSPAPQPLAVSEAEALDRVRRLPEVPELAKQRYTHRTDDLGRKLKPAIRISTSVTPSCRDDGCRYVIDVTDESEVGADPPELRFLLDARTQELFVVGSDPFPARPIAYDVWRPLEQRHRKNVARLWALPELVALRREVTGKRNIGDMDGDGKDDYAETYVAIFGGDPPQPNCKAGAEDCRWQYDVHTPNGLVASRWHTFHIDHATDRMLVDNVVTGEMVPYAQKARWK